MFELRSDHKKFPIRVKTFEEATAYINTVKAIYNIDIHLTGEIPEEFSIELYNEFLKNLKTSNVDLIILGNDLAQLEQKEDFSVLLQPIFDANEKLVEQYKAGNEKALNALLGKFLKDNKGYDPKEVKEEVIKLLK